eukprot:scaffold7210_cov87-Isochrysis_galbana.AAC.2
MSQSRSCKAGHAPPPSTPSPTAALPPVSGGGGAACPPSAPETAAPCSRCPTSAWANSINMSPTRCASSTSKGTARGPHRGAACAACAAAPPLPPPGSRRARPGEAGGDGNCGRPRRSPGRTRGDTGAQHRGRSTAPSAPPVHASRLKAAARSKCSLAAAQRRMGDSAAPPRPPSPSATTVAPCVWPCSAARISLARSSAAVAKATASCARCSARLSGSESRLSSGTSSSSWETRGGGWAVARAAPRRASHRWYAVAALPHACFGSRPSRWRSRTSMPLGTSGGATPPVAPAPTPGVGRVSGAGYALGIRVLACGCGPVPPPPPSIGVPPLPPWPPPPPPPRSAASAAASSAAAAAAASAICASCECATDQSSG